MIVPRASVVAILAVAALLACGGATTGTNGDASAPEGAPPKEAGNTHDGNHVVDAGIEAESGPFDAGAACEGGAPAPDGSPECAGLNPGYCSGGPCSPSGLVCDNAYPGFTFTCCGGNWTCVGP